MYNVGDRILVCKIGSTAQSREDFGKVLTVKKVASSSLGKAYVATVGRDGAGLYVEEIRHATPLDEVLE